MASFAEQVLYASVLFFPFMTLVYYPLRYFRRFSVGTTIFLEAAAAVVEIIFFMAAFGYFAEYPVFFVVLIIVFNPLAYKLIFDVNLGRILFSLLAIVNYANFTIFFARMLEIYLFPGQLDDLFSWGFSVSILITEVVFLLPISLFVKHCSDEMIKDNSFDFIWRAAWILPLALAILGFMTFYKPTSLQTPDMNYYVSTSIFCALVLLCQMMVYYYIAKMIRQRQAVHQLEKEVYYKSLQKVQFDRVEKQIKDTRVLRHDLRHHIAVMCQYADQGEYDLLNEYLHQYSQTMERIVQLHFTDNVVLNAILVYFADLCRSENIGFDVLINFPKEIPLDDSEVTAVFGNLIENAYQACLEMDEENPPSIRIRGSYKAHYYLFVIENPYCHDLESGAEGNFVSTKKDGSGIGLLSVKEIIEKHDGTLDISAKDRKFEVSICLPENSSK